MNETERKAADDEIIKETEEAGNLMNQIEEALLDLSPDELRKVSEYIEFIKFRRDEENYRDGALAPLNEKK